jgi:hypothetical protein
MRVVVVEAPAPVVTWQDANEQLKLDGDDTQRLYVEGLIAAATGLLDGPDGWLGRALGLQTLELYRPAPIFSSRVSLPYPPIIELLTVEFPYGDAWTPIDTSAYIIRGSTVEFRAGATSWDPANPEGIRLRFKAGYEILPAPIRAAILMMTSELYRNRGGGTADFSAASMLLETYRVYR